MNKLVYKRNANLREPPMRKFAKCPPIARYDYLGWNIYEIYFCAVFIVPIRITVCLGGMACTTILMKTCMYLFGNGDVKKEQSKMYNRVYRYLLPKIVHVICFGFGMYRIKWKKHKISDYFADYKPYEKPD